MNLQKSVEAILKSRVKGYYKTTKSGKRVFVKEHQDKRTKKSTEGKKVWYRQDNVGKAKYTISSHDGKSTHKDGSPFYDLRIFKNKPDMENYIKDLTKQGFRQRQS